MRPLYGRVHVYTAVYASSVRPCTPLCTRIRSVCRAVHGPCTRSRTCVHARVTARLCTRVRSVYRAVYGLYTCAGPCSGRVHGGVHGRVHVYTCTRPAVYGPCTRPVYGRVHGCVHVYGPCTRPCTRVRSVCTASIGTCRRVHGRVDDFCTAVHTVGYMYTVVYTVLYTVMYVWSCTRSCTCGHDRIHVYTDRTWPCTPVHGPYTAMDTSRVHSRVHDRVDGRVMGRAHGRVMAVYAARVHGGVTAVYTYTRPIYKNYSICNFLTDSCCGYIRNESKAYHLGLYGSTSCCISQWPS